MKTKHEFYVALQWLGIDVLRFAIYAAIVAFSFYVLINGLGEVFITHIQQVCSLVKPGV